MDWFNQVDATYRADLREFNEINFARFDAKVEQRFAQSDAKVEQRFAQFETRFAQFETRFAQLETRFAEFATKQEERFSGFRDDLGSRMQKLAVEAADGRTTHTRWMFVAWTTLLIPIIGLWFR